LVNENILIYDNFWRVVGEGDNSVVQFCYNLLCLAIWKKKKTYENTFRNWDIVFCLQTSDCTTMKLMKPPIETTWLFWKRRSWYHVYNFSKIVDPTPLLLY